MSGENNLEKILKNLDDFTFIDAGCGNGWVVRMVSQMDSCFSAVGVDGSLKMIEKAKILDKISKYECAEISIWKPNQKKDVVHSMEVFYYFERPDKLIQHVYENWILEGGRLIMGIDYYHENKPSHTWKEDCCITTMKMFTKNDWVNFFKTTGFKNIESWYHGKDGDWNGTLIVTGIK